MKKNKLFGILLALPFVLISCDDDSGSTPIVGNITPPTAQAYTDLQSNALNNFTQTFVLEIDDTGELNFTSNNGVEVTIYGSCLTFGGDPVEGEVEIQFVELFDRGSLLSTGIATMGKHTDGSLEMLVTGGAFYLNLYQNGQLLDQDNFCGYNMQVPASLTGGADYDMILWSGNFDENGNLVWEEVNAEGGQGGEIGIQDDMYYVWASQFGWTNIDRFYNDPRPKTTIRVDVPDGYNASNSSVYLSYNGENGLARLDTYDTETGLFSEHYGMIPIGLECHVIFVSEHNGQWVYATHEVVIEEDEIIEILHAELKTTVQANLTNLINALP